MDKYAVETDTEKDKTASEGGAVCPLCGAKLDTEASVPRCPTHGTAPFEKEQKNGQGR